MKYAKILINTCGNLNSFLLKDSSRNSLIKIEKQILEDFLQKVCKSVRSNALQETVGHSSEFRTADNIAATEDTVMWSCKFDKCSVVFSHMFPLAQKV